MTESPVNPRSGLSGWRADLLLALVFLTRLPLPDPGPYVPGALARAMRAFPLAGALIGLAGGAVAALGLGLGLPPLAAALLALLAQAALTGALHEDGLADLADGLGARGDAERRLAVMRDSSNGTFGGLALIFSVALRAAALAALPGAGAMGAALVASGALSRAMIPLAMTRMSPARPDGLGAGAGSPTALGVGLALVLGVLATLPLGPIAGLAALGLAWVAMAGVSALARRALGGYTGDVLGAVQQAAEVAVLLGVAALVSR